MTIIILQIEKGLPLCLTNTERQSVISPTITRQGGLIKERNKTSKNRVSESIFKFLEGVRGNFFTKKFPRKI